MYSAEQGLKDHHKQIGAMCAKRVFDPDERELLKSQVLEKIWESREKFTGEKSGFLGWAYTIVKNTHLSNYQYNQAQKRKGFHISTEDYFEHPPAPSDISDDLDAKEAIEDILYSISVKFSDRDCNVFRAFTIDGKTYEDISDEFIIEENSARGIVHKIRQWLSIKENITKKPITATKYEPAKELYEALRKEKIFVSSSMKRILRLQNTLLKGSRKQYFSKKSALRVI